MAIYGAHQIKISLEYAHIRCIHLFLHREKWTQLSVENNELFKQLFKTMNSATLNTVNVTRMLLKRATKYLFWTISGDNAPLCSCCADGFQSSFLGNLRFRPRPTDDTSLSAYLIDLLNERFSQSLLFGVYYNGMPREEARLEIVDAFLPCSWVPKAAGIII